MAEILLGRLTGPSGFERAVVIKRILPHLASSPRFVSMFLDEARIAAQIRHPNVVQVYELGQEDDDLFLVMEYLEGEMTGAVVRRAIARGEKLEPWVGAHIVAEACAGLHAAHELRAPDGRPLHLVHRDVSPQNVFLTYDGQIKVIDFGIAKARDRVTRTHTGQLKGKFEYMSPEQCEGLEVDRRADVFALGIVLYELTAQKRLFSRGSAMATMAAICRDPLPPPSASAPEYPPLLERIVLRALERDLDARYPTAAEMRKDLLAALRELAPDAPEEAIARRMGAMFADRIADKREMLRSVRAGTAPTRVPGEADTEIEVPHVPLAPRDVPAAAPTAITAPAGRARRRRAAFWGFGAVGVALAIAIIARQPAPRAAPPTPADAAPASTTGSAPSAPAASIAPAVPPADAAPSALAASAAPSASADATPREVALAVDSRPSGARVRVDGKLAGLTPITLHVPRRADRARVALEKPGYVAVEQPVALDVDQRLLVTLQAVRPAPRTRRSPPAGGSASPAPADPAPTFRKF
jgi:eukaryotic-like serine/threonine-protein kinase